MIMKMELNKNLERYFKKYGSDAVIADGLMFYGKRKSENQIYLKDWRNNLYLVTRTPGKRYLVEIAQNAVYDYKTVVCFNEKGIAKIILCEDAQEVDIIVKYAKLPFCEYNKIENRGDISFLPKTPVIFYKSALEYIKERLPI